MALQKTITKTWPRKGSRGIFQSGIHLKLEDDDVTVPNPTPIDQDITVDYKKGTPPADTQQDVIAEAQKLIDKYKVEKSVYQNTLYDDAVAAIDDALDITE